MVSIVTTNQKNTFNTLFSVLHNSHRRHASLGINRKKVPEQKENVKFPSALKSHHVLRKHRSFSHRPQSCAASIQESNRILFIISGSLYTLLDSFFALHISCRAIFNFPFFFPLIFSFCQCMGSLSVRTFIDIPAFYNLICICMYTCKQYYDCL